MDLILTNIFKITVIQIFPVDILWSLYLYVLIIFFFQSEEIYTAATNSPWYRWNKENCVLLQMLIMQSTKPLQISYTLIIINNTLLIKVYSITIQLPLLKKMFQMYKGIYSVGMFYYTFMQRKV